MGTLKYASKPKILGCEGQVIVVIQAHLKQAIFFLVHYNEGCTTVGYIEWNLCVHPYVFYVVPTTLVAHVSL